MIFNGHNAKDYKHWKSSLNEEDNAFGLCHNNGLNFSKPELNQ